MSLFRNRRLRQSLIGLAVALLVAATAGFIYEGIGRRRDSHHPFRVGRAVDIGGRTLNIDCAGSGSPAVVLEAGGGGYGGYGWRMVQAQVEQFTTVCWYDRAGEGWSDPAPAARSSATVIRDLHDLLHHAPVAPPYVLVGHSIGGEYIRAFAADYPTEVVGIVLVDSSHPDQREPPMMTSAVNRLPIMVRRFLCLATPVAARFGVMRFALRNVPVYVPPQFENEHGAAAMAMRSQRVKAAETEAAQGCAATDGGAIRPEEGSGDPEIDRAAASAGSVGDRPLIVLTAGQYWRPADPVAAQQLAAFHEVWVHQLQADLARLSTSGKQVVVENSDHSIPQKAPEAVAGAVLEVVVAAREKDNE